MKILCDFDGVLTEQTEEANRVLELFRLGLARLQSDPASAQRIDGMIQKGLAEMKADPSHNGWRNRDRIAAFADEDLFIRNNGLAAWMNAQAAHSPTSEVGALLEQVRAQGSANFDVLVNGCFNEMVRETQAGAMKPIDPETRPMFESLFAAGHEVVIVSNSGTERILGILRSVGLEAEAHESGKPHRLRVRGNARKFELGEQSRGFAVDSYLCETARPFYEEIIREERPQAFVGDVFSLDLALPLDLTRIDPQAFPQAKLFLRTRDYTPSWATRFAERFNAERNALGYSAASLYCLNDLRDLPRLLV